MGKNLYVVGIGPGDRGYILPIAEKIIEQSDVIIGGKRNLELFDLLEKEKVVVGNNLQEICGYIKANIDSKTIAVLASGDSGVFGIMEFLKNNLKEIDFQVVPGISAFQYLCSKLKTSWQDIRITSLHGREDENLIDMIKSNRLVAIFTGGNSSPDSICKDFVEKNLTDITVSVGENLSYPDEKIVTGNPDEISKMSFTSLSIMLVQNKNWNRNLKGLWNFTTPGIPDEMFIRGEVPMTKEEVRAVTLSKLRLRENDVVYDIGAGTGSVSIECGFKCSKGMVYAVEKEKDALELIKKNIAHFGLTNIKVIGGEAPAILKGLPKPDKVFIGGTCGEMDNILGLMKGFNTTVRVVVNAVAIESAVEAIKGFEENGFENIDIISLSVSRGRAAGGKHLMQALNPIYIISAECTIKLI